MMKKMYTKQITDISGRQKKKILEDKSEEKAHTLFISLQNTNDLQMLD